MKLTKTLHLFQYNVILQSLFCGRPGCPVLDKVDKDSTIYGDDPVVRKMFIADLTHFRLLALKDQRTKWKQRKDDRCLGRKSQTSVSRIVSVYDNFLINVIVFHRVNQRFNQLGVKSESGEVLGGILFRNCFHTGGFVVKVSCSFY